MEKKKMYIKAKVDEDFYYDVKAYLVLKKMSMKDWLVGLMRREMEHENKKINANAEGSICIKCKEIM